MIETAECHPVPFPGGYSSPPPRGDQHATPCEIVSDCCHLFSAACFHVDHIQVVHSVIPRVPRDHGEPVTEGIRSNPSTELPAVAKVDELWVLHEPEGGRHAELDVLMGLTALTLQLYDYVPGGERDPVAAEE
ncbi:hypothetical protein Pelo_16025 [Pelomyxa schiedti]|nr:hypothetical protein Pelo_16025 [Pelomyxa schiedti]